MKVILARHAETEWNQQGRIQGHCDSAVTPRGLQQTAALLQALVESAYAIRCVYSSPLGRARHMGLALAERFHCPLIEAASLQEQNFGEFEGVAVTQLTQHSPTETDALFQRNPHYCPPGGESLAQATERMIDFLHRLEKQHGAETICFVSHGQISQGVLAQLITGAIETFPRYAHPNASYTVFDWIKGTGSGLRWGMASHLVGLTT